MPVQLCHHVKEDGISCHSPAMRGEGYCYFHVRYKGRPLRTWRNRHHLFGWRFTPRSLSSLPAIQASLKKVEMALAAGCADPQRARLIRYGLQQMAANARYMEAKKAAKTAKPSRSGSHPDRAGGPINPNNSIFCDNSFKTNSLPVDSPQATDSTGAQGEGIHLVGSSGIASKGKSAPSKRSPASGATMKFPRSPG